MNFYKEKSRIMIALAVNVLIWPLGFCLPINSVQAPLWDDSLDRLPPLTTPGPFVWPQYADYPKVWNRHTPNPPTYYRSTTNNTALKLKIFIPVVLISILFALCKYFINQECGNKRSETAVTLHPPPSRFSFPPQSQQQFGNSEIPQNSRNPSSPWQGASVVFSTSGTVGDFSSWDNNIDRPPSYSDVLHSGLKAKGNKFLEVSVEPSESPPPNYSDVNLQKF